MAKVKSKTPRAHEAGNPSPPRPFHLIPCFSERYRRNTGKEHIALFIVIFAFSARCVVLDPPSALSQTYTRPQLTQSPVPRTALLS